MQRLLTVIFSFGLIQLQVAGMNVGFQKIRKNVASIAVSAGLLTSMIPYPGQLSVAIADDVQQVEKKVKKGLITLDDGEVARIFRKALQCESDGDLAEAQRLFQQVIEVEPDYIFAWSNLGNVLTSKGLLDDALLCYKKAISLYPPRDALSSIVLNKASIEMALGKLINLDPNPKPNCYPNFCPYPNPNSNPNTNQVRQMTLSKT
jgi:tetratricopeptide (TPR) repeat protein